MHSRAKRLPKLRKIDVRVPVVRERSTGWEVAQRQIDLVDRAVLAKVDGQATVHAIAMAAGVPDEEIAASLEKLETLRLVVLIEQGRRSSAPPVRLDSGVRPALKTSPSIVTEGGTESADDLLAQIDPSELDRPTLMADEIVAAEERRVEAETVRRLDTAARIELPDDEGVGDRLTLPGIGPDGGQRS